jgi:Tfp pilus assembly protein PilX
MHIAGSSSWSSALAGRSRRCGRLLASGRDLDEKPWLRRQDGSVLVISISLLAIMLTIGLASFALSDTGQVRAREQREREVALSLAEAVLYSQGFALASTWPGNATGGAAMPTVCTSAQIVAYCPDPRTLASANAGGSGYANFTSVDVAANTTWTTRIRDNGGPISDAFVSSQADSPQSGTNVATGAAYTCPAPCKWDANGDLMLWVQARAVVRGRPRSIVALLRREQFNEAFGGGNTVTAGSFSMTNSGNKTIIDAQGSQVAVRCTDVGASCTDYDANKNQVIPPAIIRNPDMPNALTPQQLARFKIAAQSANPPTYFTSCQAGLTGGIVFIDVPATTVCSDSSSAVYNTPESPGLFIMPRGSFELGGTMYGLIYMGNEQNSSGTVLTLDANSYVIGGIAVDGPGRLIVGQASGPRPTVTFLPNAFTAPKTYGTTGLVQNTWRELPPT